MFQSSADISDLLWIGHVCETLATMLDKMQYCRLFFKLIRLFLQSDSSTFAENVQYLMYKYEIPIFVWERDFSDVIKYVHNKQVISPIQLSEMDSVKELCKMRDGVLCSDLSKRDIQILIDVICIS